MTKIKLPYIHEFVDRHGVVRRYFRRAGYKQVPPLGPVGGTEFMAAYQAALGTSPLAIGTQRSRPGSVSAAIAAYYLSTDFRDGLAQGTRYMRRTILERFRQQHGEKALGTLPQQFIAIMMGKMTPHVARNWLKAVRGLCQFCVAQGMLKADPTQGLKAPRIRDTGGHHTWTESEVKQYETAHPIGSKARLALALGLYTAQRRGDVVRMGCQHISEGVIKVRQQKTGATLRIPIHPVLKAVLEATPTGHLAFLTTRTGKSYGANDFSEQFRIWCDAAGLPQHCVFHGLRKAALTRLADIGCTVHEIRAIGGHTSLREIERYTRAAEQERLARQAMARLETEAERASGKPSGKLSKND